eukprot:scaffold71171_cov18-Prasinocladus_malaysianus.AAC.1
MLAPKVLVVVCRYSREFVKTYLLRSLTFQDQHCTITHDTQSIALKVNAAFHRTRTLFCQMAATAPFVSGDDKHLLD